MASNYLSAWGSVVPGKFLAFLGQTEWAKSGCFWLLWSKTKLAQMAKKSANFATPDMENVESLFPTDKYPMPFQ